MLRTDGRIAGGTNKLVCAIWRCRCIDCVFDLIEEPYRKTHGKWQVLLKPWRFWRLSESVRIVEAWMKQEKENEYPRYET